MKVNRHARNSLVALTQRMPVPASVILDRLAKMPAPPHSVAIEVCQLQYTFGDRGAGGANGDKVVVIIRDGKAITAMLRRSWNQAFTPEVLRVDEVATWTWQKETAS